MENETFNFNQFIRDSINALTKPKEYFATLKLDGGIGNPLIKALLYGAVSGILGLIWSILNVGPLTGGLFGSAVGVMVFVWAIIGAVIGLFIGAVITLIVSAICGGSTDYTANARVTASLMVIMPINALFGFLSGPFGSVIGLLINFYALYMLYYALIGSLKAKEASAKILGLVLAGILVIFMLIGMAAKKKVNTFLDGSGSDLEKAAEKYQKEMEKSLKDLSKEFKEAAEDMEEESEKE